MKMTVQGMKTIRQHCGHMIGVQFSDDFKQCSLL